jgi:hypothetical protein
VTDEADNVGLVQTRPRKRAHADAADATLQDATHGASGRSGQHARQTNSASDYNGHSSSDGTVEHDSTSGTTVTSSVNGNHYTSQAVASPKRGRRTNRHTSSKTSDGHGSNHQHQYVPSYRPRVWTTRTSMDDLRRRAKQIEMYVCRLQQDLEENMRREQERMERIERYASSSMSNSPSATPPLSNTHLLHRGQTSVASPEPMHEDGSGSTPPSRATSPGTSVSDMIDHELLQGLEDLLSSPSTDPMDAKLESFPYACLLEGVRRTAVAFLNRHADD